jgi:hypothetical protein
MKKIPFAFLSSLTLLAIVMMVPHLAFADDSFVPLTTLPGLAKAGNTPDLAAFLNQLYRLCIGAAAVITVLQIIRGGAVLMTSQASFSKNKEAKGHIQNALIGLLLVLSPAIVFGIINPKILNLNLNFSSLKSGSTASGSTVVQQSGDNTCSGECSSGYTCQQSKCVPAAVPASCTVYPSGQTALGTSDQVSCCAAQKGCKAQIGNLGNGLPQQVCSCN